MVANENKSIEQVNHYYAFGGLLGVSTSGDVQPYKYGGKELDRMHGLDWYDFEARIKDDLRFTTMDPLCEKYYSWGPYVYCMSNPINSIDLKGDSVTVLNFGSGSEQHMGILIQNDKGKWQYYSMNGDNVYSSGNHTGGRQFDDIAVGEFESPQQFMDSQYNTKGDKNDKEGSNNYGYTEGSILPTSREQDRIMAKTFKSISKNEDYDIISNNCATAVQRTLNVVGIETRILSTVPGGKIFGGYKTTYSNSYIPSNAFMSIKINNPNGKYITPIK